MGRFIKGGHYSPKTEFKKGYHWRNEKEYWKRDWLYREYVELKKSALEIAKPFGITESAILFWLKKLKIPTRAMSEIRKNKKWGSSGDKNPMYGKRGKDVPSWKGGVTAERAKIYSSIEWKNLVKLVYGRDKGKCKRCGNIGKIDIHHIIPFHIKEYRLRLDNLISLCKNCHRWVHSKKNKMKEFINDSL